MKLIFEIELTLINVPRKNLYTIGRMPSSGPMPGNDLVLPIDDERISRYQCYIRSEKEQYFLYDGCPNDPAYGELSGKPSAFGTSVNGKLITTIEGIPLKTGDYIELLAKCANGLKYKLRVILD